MPITVHAVRSVPKAATASIAMVSSEAVSSGVDGFDAAVLEAVGFEGKADQVHLQPAEGGFTGLVGLGPATEVTEATLRRAGAMLARSCSRHGRAAVSLPGDVSVRSAEARRALAEGVILGGYRYTAFKSSTGGNNGGDGSAKLARVDIVGSAAAAAKDAVARGAAVAAGVCVARDLANEPGGSLTAPVFADKAAEVAQQAGLEVKVWTEAEIRAERLGGLLGVNRGSSQPPRFVELTYEPHSDPAATLAYVGKGITFDAGGLSIKTAQGMMAMKMDMCGAAAIIGAMSVLPVVGAPVRVKGYLPMTDNMLGGDATRPGDVLTTRSGKTIEVLNTDAEGRLILADALALACEDEPDAIVDLATLTGACMVALGPSIAGLMGNRRGVHRPGPGGGGPARRAGVAAAAAGRLRQADRVERGRHQEHRRQPRGSPDCGADPEGVRGRRHLLGPPRHRRPGPAESDDAEITKGGTGFGVRTLIELASTFSAAR